MPLVKSSSVNFEKCSMSLSLPSMIAFLRTLSSWMTFFMIKKKSQVSPSLPLNLFYIGTAYSGSRPILAGYRLKSRFNMLYWNEISF